MFDGSGYYKQTANYVADKIEEITDTRTVLTPSEWAETVRILPTQASALPGPFSFDATPYWKEVIDNFDSNSPIHFISVQKGAQVGATVAVLENIVGYGIDHVRTAGMLFYTADSGLAEMRVDQNIVPMIQQSDLSHLIQSNDEMRKGKQGLTNKKIEWAGGGSLIPLGAINASKQRSLSAPWLLRDEVSGWPLAVGRDASPMQLTETRTNSYELSRKILDLSTPNITATDAISVRFKLGDQRYFNVPCKHCDKMQVLKFRNTDHDGVRSGLIWETNSNGDVVAGTVRYVCKFCGGEHINEDKLSMFKKGKWIPTAVPSHPAFRSYHLSALYAPYFARTWEAIARAWVTAWDDENNIPRDGELLQVFYNNDLGEPYELKTDKLKLHQVSTHRRSEYRTGEIPNNHAMQFAGGEIEVITMSVDVHDSFLSVGIMGWAPSADRAGYSCYSIDKFNLAGDCKSVDSEPWDKLAEIIDDRTYKSNGKEYRIAMTMVDASYLPDVVYMFCEQWDMAVYPIRGRDKPLKGAKIKYFDMLTSSTGNRYAAITVDLYKDRWSNALKRNWNGIDKMPRNYWSAPTDMPDKDINELTVEHKREKKDPQSGKNLGTYWHRPGNARNELWDHLVYNTAALEMMAYDVCSQNLGLDALIWSEFWEEASNGLFWTDC